MSGEKAYLVRDICVGNLGNGRRLGCVESEYILVLTA